MFASTITTSEISKLEQIDFGGKIVVVDEVGQVYNKAIKTLEKEKVIGFDTETKPCFIVNAPRNKTALLQLSGENVAYIFKLHRIGLTKELIRILSAPTIIKVGAAVNDDITGLKRYKDFNPNSFIDLQNIAQKFGIKDRSVKKLSAIILGKRVSKSQQLSNWESAELSEAQKRYAAIDAWVCREMYLELMESNE